eukprot:3357044-Rhodomonas_salina.1
MAKTWRQRRGPTHLASVEGRPRHARSLPDHLIGAPSQRSRAVQAWHLLKVEETEAATQTRFGKDSSVTSWGALPAH